MDDHEAGRGATDAQPAQSVQRWTTWSAAQPASVPEPPAVPKRRRWPWIVVGGATAVLVFAAVGSVVIGGRGHSYPDEWRSELVPLVGFVERTKGTEFEHPVRLHFVTEGEFDRMVTPSRAALADAGQELSDAEATMRALGLNGGTGSLLDQRITMGRDGVAAFYEPDEQQIVVPGADLTSLPAQASFVHELTHALQDQLGQLDDRSSTSDESAAFRALVEGDAQRVSTAWYRSLDTAQQAEIDAQAAASYDAPDETRTTRRTRLAAVNPALLTSFTFPYAAGEPFATALVADGRLDAAFADPPRSTADVIDPHRWSTYGPRIEVPTPTRADDEPAIGPTDSLGALNLYDMLATAMEPAEALEVVGGWGGDRMITYRNESSHLCMRVALTGVDGTATAALDEAIATWAASRPADSVTSRRDEEIITLDVCDPGIAPPSKLTVDIAKLPLTRADLVMAWSRDQGRPFDEAVCIADGIVGAFAPDEFNAEPDAEGLATIDDIAASCT